MNRILYVCVCDYCVCCMWILLCYEFKGLVSFFYCCFNMNGADKKVFPNFYILGWYSTGSDAQESDMIIHKSVSWKSISSCTLWIGYQVDLLNLLNYYSVISWLICVVHCDALGRVWIEGWGGKSFKFIKPCVVGIFLKWRLGIKRVWNFN